VRTHGARLLIAVAVAVATYLLFPSAPAVELPMYEVGSVAPENVIAPFAFRVPKPAAELQAERAAAARATPPVFAFQPAELDSARAELAGFGAILDAAFDGSASDGGQSVEGAAAAAGVRITPAELQYLRSARAGGRCSAAVGRTSPRSAAGRVERDARRRAGRWRSPRRTRRLVETDSIAHFNTLLRAVAAASTRTRPRSGGRAVREAPQRVLPPTLTRPRATERRRAEAAQRSSRPWFVQGGREDRRAHEVVGARSTTSCAHSATRCSGAARGGVARAGVARSSARSSQSGAAGVLG
jgi:hypothetical protein